MNEIQTIQSKIYEIRGQRVMLDRDLAELYQVTTGNLNKAVKRNIRRFPPDFMFQLTKEEWYSLRFQIGILNTTRGAHTKYLPYAFTEQGLAMLSGILNSDVAIDVNISIMRAFVAIRRMASALPKPDVSADVAQLRKDFEELKLDIEDILRDQNDINESTRMQLDAISRHIGRRTREGTPTAVTNRGATTGSQRKCASAGRTGQPPGSRSHGIARRGCRAAACR